MAMAYRRKPQTSLHIKLPVETWQQIFREASHIETAEEFSMSASAHVGLPWEGSDNWKAARIGEDDLFDALETRKNIVLVCKAWYSMGVKILYSHFRLGSCDEMGYYKFLKKDKKLLYYTRRLTISPGQSDMYHSIVRKEYFRQATWVFTKCRQLQILDAPAEFFSHFSFHTVPEPLKVVMCEEYTVPHRWPSFLAWTGVHVMRLSFRGRSKGEHDLPKDPQPIVFPVLENLTIFQGSAETVRYLSRSWNCPRLNTLHIKGLFEGPWSRFLGKHAATLHNLTLSTQGMLPSLDTYEDDEDDCISILFPNLRTLCMDYWEDVVIFGPEVERVVLYDIGYPEGYDMEESQGDLERVCNTLNIHWQNFPKLASCCISGWRDLLLWMERQPEMVECVERMKDKGVVTEILHLDDRLYL